MTLETVVNTILVYDPCHCMPAVTKIPLTELFLRKCQIIKFWLKKHHLFVIITLKKLWP